MPGAEGATGPSSSDAVAERQKAQRPEAIGAPTGGTDSAFKGLSRAEAIKRVVKTGSKALAKSLALSAAVLGPGFLLLATGAVIAGMIWLFLGSFGLMAWTYRKPWRLGPISCLIPPVAAAACYAVQLWLFGQAMPHFFAILVAVAAGAALGFIRGDAHTVYEEKGVIFAQRTLAYLGIWVACYGVTQCLGLFTRQTLLVQGGLVTGAFSTAMLAVVSFMLLQRRKALVAAVSVIVAGLACVPHDAQAEDGIFFENTEQLAQEANKAVNIAVRAFLPTDLGCELHRKDSKATPDQDNGQFAGSVSYECRLSRNHYYSVSASARGFQNKGPRDHKDWVDKTRKRFASRVANPGVRWRGFSYANASIGDDGVSSSQHASGSKSTVYTYTADGTNGGWRVHVLLKAVLPPGSSRPRDYGQLVATGIAADIARQLPNLYEGRSESDGEESTVSEDQSESSRASPESQSELSTDDMYKVPDVKCGVEGATGPCETGDDPSVTGEGYQPPSVDTYDPTGYVPPTEDHWHAPSKGAIAAAAAAIAAILLAAGIAANVAQAMAVSMAQAMQAGVELTADEVRRAALGEAPPPFPPPRIDYAWDGSAFQTNEAGQYFVPDADDNWHWASEPEAREAAARIRADVRAEREAKDRQAAQFIRQGEDMLARSRHDTQARYAAERTEEGRANASAAEDLQRRDALFEGIDKTLRRLPEDARYHAAMAELYDAQARGDTKALNDLWREISGDRKEQLRKGEEASAVYQRQAIGFGVLETGAAKVRDLSKDGLAAGLGLATGGSVTLLEGTAVAAIGLGGLMTEGAVEHGMQVNEDGQVEFDSEEAVRGAARGARKGLGALVSGVPTNGNAALALAKSGFAATSDAAQTYADVHHETGDRDAALTKSGRAFGIGLAQNAMGEAWDEMSRLAGQRAAASNLAEGVSDSALPTWSSAVAQNQQLVHAAGKKATDFVGGVATGMAVDDKDLATAMSDTAVGMIEGEVSGKVTGTMFEPLSSTPDSDLSDDQRRVVDRLQDERMNAGIAKRGDGPERPPATQTQDTPPPSAKGSEAETAGGEFPTGSGYGSDAPPTRTETDNDTQPMHRHAAESEPFGQTPADREVAANAAHRDSLRKVWQAEQEARAKQEAADADPGDRRKRIEADEAKGKLTDAKKELHGSEIEAQEATAAARDKRTPRPHDLEDNEATWDDVLGPDTKPTTPADREAMADAAYRDKLRKVWLAEQEAKAAQERLDDNPDDTWSEMNVAEAQGKLQGAKNELFAAEMEGQEASEARRAPPPEDSGPYTGRDILGVPSEDLDPTLRPIQDHIRQHGDFPESQGQRPPEDQGAQASDDGHVPQATKKYEDLPVSERPDLQPSSLPSPDEFFRLKDVPSGPDADFYDSVRRTIEPEGHARDALDALEKDPTNPELRARARAAVAEAKARHGDLKEAAMIADDRARRRMYPEQAGPGPDLPDDEHKRAWERRRVIESAVKDNERTVQGLSDKLGALESDTPPPASPPQGTGAPKTPAQSSTPQPPLAQQPGPSHKDKAASDIEDILKDAKAKGQSDDLKVLDPTAGENIPGGNDGDGPAEQGGRGGSMEEANRREIWLDDQGRPILGGDNPEDRIPKDGYRIRIDPDTGEVRCRFGKDVKAQFKKGMEARALQEHAEKIKAALEAQREKLARVPEQGKP